MAGESVGEIYVDVGADTTTLEAKLKAKLDELSKKLQAKIQATVDAKMAQTQLLALRDIATKALTVPITFSKDTLAKAAAVGESIQKEVKAAISTIPLAIQLAKSSWPKIKADLSANLAVLGVQIGAWVKEQSLKTVHIGVDISKSALAKAGAQLQTFTGLNAVRGELAKFSAGLENFFNDLPGVAQGVLKLTSKLDLLGTGIGSVFSTIMTLLPAISGLGAAALALPGILAAAGAEAAVLVVAIKDAPPAVKSAVDSYKSLGKVISTNFWKGAKTNVVDFFTTLKSNVATGIGGLSTTMGKFAGTFASELQTSLNPGLLSQFFTNIEGGFTALTPAAKPFSAILANLALYGTSLLPAIATWITKIATSFDAWLSNAMETGQLTADLKGLGSVLDLVFNAAKGLIGIITGIGTAAQNAGIGNLLTPLQSIATVVNSPAFQHALTTLFVGLAAGAQALLGVLPLIGDLINGLSPILGAFFADVGKVVGQLVANLAIALNSPVFKQGLAAFFAGILDFIKPLIPLMPLFADKLAIIGTFAGQLLTTLGPVFASILKALVPVLGAVLTAIGPLAQALGPVLSNIFKVLAPVILDVVKAVTPLISAVVAILPPILKLVDALVSALGPYLSLIVGLFVQLIKPILTIVGVIATVLTPIIGPLVGIIGQLVSIALKPFIDVLNILAPILVALEPILTLIAQIIGAVLTTAVDALTGKFSDIGTTWAGVWNDLVDFFNKTIKPAWQAVSGFFEGIWNDITGFFTGAWDTITKGMGVFGKLVSLAWNKTWTDVGNFFQGIWNGILSFIKGIDNAIIGAIQGFVNGAIDVINGLTGAINAVSSVVGIPKIGKVPHVALPRLADGATILPRTGGTAAILGEGGRAESVVDTGLMNSLLSLVLTTLPKAVSALSNKAAVANNSTSNGGDTYNHWENHLDMPDTDDPEAASQDLVNRLAAKVGI